jgi:peroxiredoxin
LNKKSPSNKILDEIEYFSMKIYDKNYKRHLTKKSFENICRSYGKKYFTLYKTQKNSQYATDALNYAIFNWYQIGDYKNLKKALPDIDNNSNSWNSICKYILQTYARASYTNKDMSIYHEGIKTIEGLRQIIKPKIGKTRLNYDLGFYYFNSGNNNIALNYFKNIISINADNHFIFIANGFIYEINKLQVGMDAPNIITNDINGNTINLYKMKGKNILIHFWSYNCGPAFNYFNQYRSIYKNYGKSKITMIGINTDGQLNKLKKITKDEKFNWSQILDNDDKNDNFARLFNVHTSTKLILINKYGKIKFIGSEIEKLRKELSQLK